jgi:hypothetical protein
MSDGAPDFGYAARRLYHAARPPLFITRPPDGVRVERDVPVTARDAGLAHLYATAALLGPTSGRISVREKPASRHQRSNCAPV